MRTRRLSAALLGTAVLAAGCTSTVAGAAAPATPDSAGPLTDVLGPVEIDAVIDEQLRVSDIAATPDGGFVVLMTGDLGNNHRSALVELVPGDGGLTVGAVTEGAPFADLGEVHVAPDGTVVALAPVLPEPGDTGSGDGGREQDLALAVLAPGADEPNLVRIAADAELGTPDLGSGVLSPDGATLYASLRWTVGGDTVNRLAAVDVVTGEVTASAPLQVETPGQATAYDVALRPDGGVAALVTTDRDAEGEVDGVVLAEYDAHLRPVGDPVEVVDEEESTGHALAVLPSGAVVVSLSVGDGDTAQPRLVTLRDGAVQSSAVLPGAAADLVAAPDGSHVYLSRDADSGDVEGGVAVTTVDLATGAVVADVPLCPDGYASPIALAADGLSVAVTAACDDGRGHADHAFLAS